MNLLKLYKSILPFVKPYKWLVILTLILTLIGALMAQVNAVVLDWTVDSINDLIGAENFAWSSAAKILAIISGILLGKELIATIVTFAQNYYGERMRIFVSRDMSQSIIEKVLTFRMAFFSNDDNETGKLQTRITQGVS
ncbi:MAG: ABC transporter, partial [Muribaculaceae bacterium]|nr:ABC transporter [Muribaculaceae bacterium]